MFAKFCFVACFAFLAPPASARIHPNESFRLPAGPVTAPVTVPALRLAQRVWHPTCGQLRLQADARSQVRDAGAGEVAGWATPGICVIHVAAGRWSGAPELCETVLHEAGHVANFHEAGGPDGGYHSGDPRNIMYPTQFVIRGVALIRLSDHRPMRVIQWGGVDRRCLRAYHVHGQP